MLKSMFSGVSGIKNNQIKLDVIGNNIANVNTIGYKAGRVNFQDMLSQTLRSSAPPQPGRGGINPAQVGLGVMLGGIDNIHTQGGLQSSGRTTDLAIQGGGYFVVNDGQRNYYTRDGSFSIGIDGTLVNSANGLRLQGWVVDGQGNLDTDQQVSDINLGLGERILTRATSEIKLGGNLDATTADGGTHRTFVDIYDSLGNSHEVEFVFSKQNAGEWQLDAFMLDSNGERVSIGNPETLTFDTNGQLMNAGPPSLEIDFNSLGFQGVNDFTGDDAVNLGFASMTQVVAGHTAMALEQDGYPAGVLNSFTIDKSGVITGSFTNGLVSDIGQIALARFNNPDGLSKVGNNLFDVSGNSGQAVVGSAGQNGRGTIETGTLEMSNVDLATEFTEMIITTRAYQANSRVVTTSDEMLQELMQLKR